MKDIYRSGCRGYDRPDPRADSVEATREARRKIREKYKEAVKAAHDEMTMKEKMEHTDIIVW